MNNPFFTIIVVALNAEKDIKSTIESILEQSFQNFEVIVKDGCSTDNTLNMVPDDKRITVVCKKDNSVYDAMNQATQLARGEYIYYLNCGDRLAGDDILEVVFKTIKKSNKKDIVVFGDEYHEERKKVIIYPNKLSDYFFYRTTICHQCVFFPKRLIVDHATYNTNYKISADFELLFRLYNNHAFFIHIDKIIVLYKGFGISGTKKGKKQNKNEKKEILKQKYGPIKRSIYFIYKALHYVLRKAFCIESKY